MRRSRNKRSLTIARHRTSVFVEEEFWAALAEIARAEGKSIAALVEEIDKKRGESSTPQPNLSAAIRLYVLERMQKGRDA